MKSPLPKKTSFLNWFSCFLIILLPSTIYGQTVPDAPTIGMATATGATTATVSFTAPSNNGGSPILRYVATSSPAGITGIFTGAGSGTINITGLTTNTAYNFTIVAINAIGESIPSETSNWIVPARGPNEPTNVVAVAGNEQASITFTPPTDDGGTPIFIYTVAASPGNVMTSGISSPIIVPGLTNGTAYTFVVTAENSMGAMGTPSSPSNSVTPATIPNTPTIGVATATGITTANVTFTAPSNNGGSPITRYVATSSPAGGTGTFTGAGSGSIYIFGLTTGTSYTFSVKAENSVGISTASAESNQITTYITSTPNAPRIRFAEATGATTATVDFTDPDNIEGSIPTGFVATSSPAGGTGTSGRGSRFISVSGLTAGTSYTFSVKAENSAGISPASAESNQITTFSIPNAPTIGTATVTGATTATVTFTAPSNNGGTPITRYVATSWPAGGTGTFTGAGSGTISVSGLTAGTSYTFSIKAENGVGNSNASSESNQITTFSIPNAPTIGTATVTGATTATVTFTAPSNNGGAPITRYVATSSPAGGTGTFTGAGSGSISISDLTAGTNYTFSVKAENSVGNSNASSESNQITTPASRTAQPMVAGQVTLRKFTAVGADAGGGPLVTVTFNDGTYTSFFAYASSFRGGVRVAIGDVDGDGNMEIVTGAGPGGGPQVNVYGISQSGVVTLKSSFFAFSAPSFTGGIYVATGRTNADIYEDIIIGAGASGGSRVQVYAGSANGVVTTSTLNDFFAYSPAFIGGVRVAAGDRDGDLIDEVITAPASNAGYNIKSFKTNGKGNSPTVVDNFFAFNNTTSVGGLSIASGYLNSGNISDIIVGTSNGGFGVILDSNNAGILATPFPGFTGTINVGVAQDANGIIYPMALVGPSGGPKVVVYKTGASSLVETDNLFVMDVAFTGGLFGTPSIKSFENYAPTNITLSNETISENNAIGASIGTLDSRDRNLGDSFTYSLVSGTGSTDNSKFYLSENTLKAAAAFDFETKSTYSIRIQTSDAAGERFQKEFTLTIGNVNEAPTAIDLSNAYFDENNAIGATIGTLASTDSDAGDSFTYSLVSGTGSTDNSKFTLSGNMLKAAEAFDFETKSSYSIRIQTSDAAGLSFQKEFTLTIVNVNEAPTAIILNNATINENNATGATIGTLASADSDAGDSFTYSLVSGTGSTDNSKFTLSGNTLKAAEVFDFETKSSYSIRIQTSDLFGLSFQKEFTLTIVNKNEAPTAIILNNATINENNATGATIGTLASTDSDTGESFTYSLVSGDGSSDNSKFTISGNSIKAAEAFDFETKSTYSIRIQTSDLTGLSFQKEFTLTVINVNEAPTAIALSTATIDENNAIGATIGTLASTDSDAGDSFTYSLVSGDGSSDNSKFTISGNMLKAAEAFDFETKSTYSIRIQSSDIGGLTFQKEFTLTIVNVNEAPTAIALSTAIINENNAIRASIGTLASTDSDSGDYFTYSLVSGAGSTDNSKFTISENTLKAAEAFDFETKSSYSIRIQSSDIGGLSFQKEFTLTVLNVNEAPTAIALSTATIDENNAIGASIGTLASTDADAGDSFTYSFVSGTGSTDNSKFTLSGNTLKAAESFDFETKSSYSIRIQTIDRAGLSFQKEFTLTVLNVNEAPTAIALSTATIDENNAIGASIGTLASTDSDAGDSFTYSLVSGTGSTDNSKFSISGNTLKAAEAFDFETKSTYSIRIQTSDAGGLSFQKTISISVKDINDSPSALLISKTNLFETNAINQIVGLLSTTDQDPGESHTYSLVSGSGSTDNADFNISGNQLRAAKVYSFASKSSYSIRLRTTDKAGSSFENTYNVTISQLPTLTGTGNEAGSQTPTAASTTPKISKGYKSNLQVSGSNLVSYSWTPSSGLSSSSIANPVAELTETTTYSVLVTNSFGSSVTLNITIEVMVDFNLVVSNIVTPNGDGVNDNWQIENLINYPNNELVISDRNNNILYRQKNYSNNWDGQYNGSVLPSGTYYYLLTFNSGESVKRGYITIINNLD